MSKVGMRRETLDARMMGARRETIDESHVSRLTPPGVSGLTSRASWPKVKLGEIGRVAMCKRVLNRETADTGEIPFFKIGTFGKKANAFITRDKFEYYRTHYAYPKKGNVLISAAGTIGRLVVFNGEPAYFQDSNIVWLEHDGQRLCDKYLYYSLLGHEWQFTQGATIQRLYNDDVRNAEIPLPPLPVQRRIADVLSAYDDLIENNRRRIAILEETARLLFQTDIVGGDWSCVPVSELIAINPKVAKPRNTIVRYVPMSALSTSGMTVDLHEIEMRSKATSVCFVNGDVLLARITPCLENGKTAYVNFLGDDEVACGSSEFIVMRGQNVSPYFTYCTARLEAFRGIAIKSMVGASGRQRVQESCFKDFSIQYPDSVALHRFDQTVKPMFQQIAFLSKQNAMLAASRDMLLPRLMKGQPCFSSL